MLARGNISMGFPPFRGAVRAVILVNAAIYVLLLLAMSFAQPWADRVFNLTILSPEHIRQGWIWQFLTYGFVHKDPLGFLLSMVGVYFIGGAVQDRLGPGRFVQLYLISTSLAGLLGFAASLTGVVAQGPAFGSGPAANALLMVFYLLYRDAPVMLFPIPIPIPVKYIVLFTAAVEAAYLLLTHFSLFFLVQLLGMASGYAWMALLRGHGPSLSYEIASIKSWYYRWKRRRAARQFEVYMREHGGGPYVDPLAEDRDPRDKTPQKKNGESRGPWVH